MSVVETNIKKLLNPQRTQGGVIFHGKTTAGQICTVWYNTLTGEIEFPKTDADRAYSNVMLVWFGGQNGSLYWFRDEPPIANRRVFTGGEQLEREPFGSQPGDKVLEQSIKETNIQYKAIKKAEETRTEGKLKEPWEMVLSEFLDEYERVMNSVAKKEKKGGLDPNYRANYKQITPEEQALLGKDWKAFSRKRGFSEEDIIEYERWLTLSGQRDNLPGAINDPWRRGWGSRYPQIIYMKHIEHALASKKTIPNKVLQEYESLKGRLKN